jgi:hypothetical protein
MAARAARAATLATPEIQDKAAVLDTATHVAVAAIAGTAAAREGRVIPDNKAHEATLEI